MDLWLVRLAAFKALTAATRGTQRASSLHIELICNLAAAKNASTPVLCMLMQLDHFIFCSNMQIAESLRRFGVSDATRHLLVAKFDGGPDDVRRLSRQTPRLP